MKKKMKISIEGTCEDVSNFIGVKIGELNSNHKQTIDLIGHTFKKEYLQVYFSNKPTAKLDLIEVR